MTATMTTLEKVGARLYFSNSPFSAKDAIKRLGSHWDGDRRQWWIGAAKKAEAETLVAKLNGSASETVRVPTAESAKLAESVGLDANTPADIVADKLQDAGRDKEAAAIRTPKEDLSDCRVYAKVEYKGRTYYVIAETKDRTRCRLATLQEDGPVFWAQMAECSLLKTYQGREKWDGRRYSGKTITVYTTLGSLRDFVETQKRADAAGHPACPECGKRGELVRDLEDGGMKCYRCCDMPE